MDDPRDREVKEKKAEKVWQKIKEAAKR